MNLLPLLPSARTGRRARMAGLTTAACLTVLLTSLLSGVAALAQTASVGSRVAMPAGSATLTGTVLDPRGVPLPGATVMVRDEANGATEKMTSDAQGKYSFASLPADKFTVQVDGNGFTTSKRTGLQLAAGQATDLAMPLELRNVSEEITVEAAEANSVAAALAPMDALLEQTSRAHGDYAGVHPELLVADRRTMASSSRSLPAPLRRTATAWVLASPRRSSAASRMAITTSTSTASRSTTPTRRRTTRGCSSPRSGLVAWTSTARRARPRRPGPRHLAAASTCSRATCRRCRPYAAGVSYGSFNTFLLRRRSTTRAASAESQAEPLEWMCTTCLRTATRPSTTSAATQASLKAQYKFSDKLSLTGFSGVVRLDANTPNFNPTRCQMYGASPTGAYSCAERCASLRGSGLNFYLTDNSDPANYLDYQYNRYHVPTDFEYVGIHKEFAHGDHARREAVHLRLRQRRAVLERHADHGVLDDQRIEDVPAASRLHRAMWRW